MQSSLLLSSLWLHCYKKNDLKINAGGEAEERTSKERQSVGLLEIAEASNVMPDLTTVNLPAMMMKDEE